MDTFPQRQEMLSELFTRLDAEQMGPDYVRALASQELPELIRATAAYFRSRPARPYCRTIDRSRCTRETADRAVRADVTVIDIPWQFPDGKIDWFFNPTLQKPPVNYEWVWQLNRMEFWRDMCAAFEETGDEKYAAVFNSQLYSWIASAGRAEDEISSGVNWLWRTIETGLRMMFSWALSFETFRKSPAFTDENICLMLSSMYRQCVHLQNRHKVRGNWLLMEMSGLYTFGALFPEFSSALPMRHYAAEKFSEAILDQILPDGMHDELSPDYHTVMFWCALAFYNIAAQEGIESELPAEFIKKLELSFESVLDMSTPGLTSPRTNDCFTSTVAAKMRRALEIFPEREDFIWGNTGRREGKEPHSSPTSSRFLPWAGFAVMRSDWGPDAAYCCFDVGTLGMAHRHQDKLNINIYKGAQELICDDGGGQYEHSIYRAYGVSAADHNTVLVDGLLQRRDQPRKAEKPIDCSWITNEKFDYARGNYADEFGVFCLTPEDAELPLTRPAKHTREVRFCKPEFFCVQDTLTSLDGKAHSYEMRLHLDTVKVEKLSAIPGAYLSDYGQTWDILIVPLFPGEAETALLSGSDTPPMGGWFVGRNDKALHKSTTLTMTVSNQKDCRFATLLIPVRRSEALPEIEKRSANVFTLRLKGQEYLIDLEHLSE